MKNVVLAVVASLLVHGLLLSAAVAIRTAVPRPDVGVALDLSQLDLSFAEREDETAAPCAAAPSSPMPPAAERPPVPEASPSAPPEPEEVKFPEPEERVRPMSAPPSVSTPAPQQAKVEAPPRPRRAIRPDYPQGARQRGEQGEVVLELEVAADGACSSVRMVRSSGFAELDAAAIKAVRAAKFIPAQAAGRAVAAVARLTVTFVLDR